MQGSCSLLHPDSGFAKIPWTKRNINNAHVLILRKLLAPALFGWMFERERGHPGAARSPQGEAKGQTVPSELPVTSSQFVILSLSGCPSSLGTLLQADLPCCQQKGPPGAPSRTGWGCAAVVAASAAATLLQPGNLPRALLALSPSTRAQESNWLPLPSSSALHPLGAQRTARAPGRHQARP